MINILDEIVEKTKIKIAEKKQGLSLEELRSKLDFENLKASNFKKSIQDLDIVKLIFFPENVRF
mgnify:CR=1 FL=1